MLTFQNSCKIPVVLVIRSRGFLLFYSFIHSLFIHSFISSRPIYHRRSFKGPQYTDEFEALVDVVLEKLELLLLSVLLTSMKASETPPRRPSFSLGVEFVAS